MPDRDTYPVYGLIRDSYVLDREALRVSREYTARTAYCRVVITFLCVVYSKLYAPKYMPFRSNKANMSSQLQDDNGSFADDEYVRQVLYPWDTQLHRHICGGVE